MTLDEQQLSVVLQASIDKAGELVVSDGGFMPFGLRAKPDGEMEFIQLSRKSRDEPIQDLVGRLNAMLAKEAKSGEIVGAALVGLRRPPSGEGGMAISVQLETTGFSRAIMVPFTLEEGKVALGKMAPFEAEPAVFA